MIVSLNAMEQTVRIDRRNRDERGDRRFVLNECSAAASRVSLRRLRAAHGAGKDGHAHGVRWKRRRR